MTWTLDYDKTSDFDDVSGHWHVEALTKSTSRVFYACDIKTRGSVPGPILNYISKAALKSATSWVKKEAEAMPEAREMPAVDAPIASMQKRPGVFRRFRLGNNRTAKSDAEGVAVVQLTTQ
jgi:hypothetical protein